MFYIITLKFNNIKSPCTYMLKFSYPLFPFSSIFIPHPDRLVLFIRISILKPPCVFNHSMYVYAAYIIICYIDEQYTIHILYYEYVILCTHIHILRNQK